MTTRPKSPVQNEAGETDGGRDPNVTLWIRRVVAMVLGIMIAYYGLACWILRDAPSDLGELGDMFGGVNALFSGLTFGGVVIAIYLQRRELRVQRDELKLTRDELKGQHLQMQIQNSTLQQQALESTFFQMLRLHHESVDSISISGPLMFGSDRRVASDHYIGRAAFGYVLALIRSELSGPLDETGSHAGPAYELVWRRHGSSFVDYYNRLAVMFGALDTHHFENATLLVNLIRAQLSQPELAVLFFYGQVHGDFRAWIERHGLLAHLQVSELIPMPQCFHNQGAFRK